MVDVSTMDPRRLHDHESILDPGLSDEAQAAEAARREALRLEAIASERPKPGFHYEVVVESFDPEFEEPPIIASRTRGQARAPTEAL